MCVVGCKGVCEGAFQYVPLPKSIIIINFIKVFHRYISARQV